MFELLRLLFGFVLWVKGSGCAPLTHSLLCAFVFSMQLVRINLSEQTDVSDLFGSDLPVPDSEGLDQSEPLEGGATGSGARFAWCDGIFLSALKAGKWLLLDELNLATQVSDAWKVLWFVVRHSLPEI